MEKALVVLLTKRPFQISFQIFKDALSNTQFDTFYIEATSVADYEVFVEYHWDEEEMVEISAPTLTDKIWDLWEEYNK